MSALHEKRFGRFSVPRAAIEDNLGGYIYKDMIPLKVEMDYCEDAFLVSACADFFEKVPKDGTVPWYAFELEFEMINDTDITGAIIGGYSEFRSIKWTKRNV